MNKIRPIVLSLLLCSLNGWDSLYLSYAPILCLPASAEQGKHKDDHKSKTEKALHRVDFMVNGTSCATCLLRIERELKKAPGVVKAAVSILSPYPGVVIYDANKTTFEEVLTALKNETATLSNQNDVSITKIPAVLLPAIKHSAQEEPKTADKSKQ
jgi:copper chaperone CopZ